MAKLNFQQPLLHISVSHDPSEIILICWFGAQETFLIISVKNTFVLLIFVETWYILSEFFDGENIQK